MSHAEESGIWGHQKSQSSPAQSCYKASELLFLSFAAFDGSYDHSGDSVVYLEQTTSNTVENTREQMSWLFQLLHALIMATYASSYAIQTSRDFANTPKSSTYN